MDNGCDCDLDAAEAVRLINEEPFLGSTLQASTAPVLNRVVITNLRSDVDRDYVVLHLEQRKVTLVDDVEVTVEEFDAASRAVIVSFTDSSGRDRQITRNVVFEFTFMCQYAGHCLVSVCLSF